jgi:hypothetical protein
MEVMTEETKTNVEHEIDAITLIKFGEWFKKSKELPDRPISAAKLAATITEFTVNDVLDAVDEFAGTGMESLSPARTQAYMDARAWSEEVSRLNPEIDSYLMIGWFANCIQVTRDETLKAHSIQPGGLTAEDALMGFICWMTTRKFTVKVGAEHDVTPLVECLKMFDEANGLGEVTPGFPSTVKSPKEPKLTVVPKSVTFDADDPKISGGPVTCPHGHINWDDCPDCCH